jgi:hypothetical protein
MGASAPIDNRSLISTTPKAGYIKAYDTNNDYAQVFVPAGPHIPGVSLYGKNTNTITPDKLKTEQNITIPGASPSGVDESGALVAGGRTALQEMIKTLTPPETEAQKTQKTLQSELVDLVSQGTKKGEDQTLAEQNAGIPELRKQFADINGQIATKSAEYDVLVKANENKPITMASIIGNERAILNAKAADIGLLTARAQALGGQLEVAQETVNRSIDLRYSTIENELKIKQAQLDALAPILSREEKIAAAAQQTLLDNQKQALADKKAAEKEKTNFVLDLASKYPDAKINLTDTPAQAQAKVQNSRIYQQATRLAGGTSSGNTGKITIPQNQNIPSSQNSSNGINEDVLKNVPPATANLVKQIANYQVDISKVTSLAKGERQRLAELVSAYDPSYDMSQYAARSAVRKDFESGKSSQNIRSLNTAVGHLATLQKSGEALKNSNFPLWNKVSNLVSSAKGDPEVSNFLVAANAVESELATVFKGTGATDQEIKAWRENLNQNMSPAQLQGAITQAIELMGSRLGALKSQYEMGMGKPSDFTILNEHSRAILQSIGVNIEDIEPSNNTNSPNADLLRNKYKY